MRRARQHRTSNIEGFIIFLSRPNQMSSAHEQHGEHGHHGPRTLPASLAAPEVLLAWRMRALIVAAVFALLSLVFVGSHDGRNHLIRAYLMGYMTCFNLAGGSLVL